MKNVPWSLVVGYSAAIVFAASTELFTADGVYSDHGAYRLQTEAFLDGRLSLGPSPVGHGQDAIWAPSGLHQVWGLGVPLLRLPFEVIGRPFFAHGFPDRLVFLFFHALTGIVVWSAFTRVFRAPIAAVLAVFSTVLHPALLLLASTRFAVYEEAVAYGCLFGFLDLALLVRVAADPRPRTLLWLALVAGFGGVIRPTLHLIGAVAFAAGAIVVLLHHRPLRRRTVLSMLPAAALYLIGPVFVLVTNQLRFGDPFELGYALSLSSVPPNDVALRFDWPFQHAPIGDAAVELFSFLFLAGEPRDLGYFTRGFFPGQSELLRWRELYFQPFDLVTAAFVFSSAVLAPLVFVRGREHRSAAAAAAWGFGLGGVVILFLFYLRAPSLTSRYLLDFLPCFAASQLALYLAIEHRSNGAPALVTAILIAGGIGYGFTHQTIADSTDPKKNEGRWVGWDSASTEAPALPEAHRCEPESTAQDLGLDRHGIPSNLGGWIGGPGCGVSVGSLVFLPWSPCYALEIQPLEGFDRTAARVRDGLETLELVEDAGHTMTFCGSSRRAPEPGTPEHTRLVSIRWVDAKGGWERPPAVRLLAVRAAAAAR